jgi:nucleotide-binding universal stress UspA family protein
MEKKILVAVDRSVYSSNSFNYLFNVFAGVPDISFHLLHIVSTTAASAGREWMHEQDLMQLISPQCRSQFESAERFMEEARERFEEKGFSPDRVSTEVRLSRMSVVKDILVEASKGLYDALVVGRRGSSKITDLLIGSVSSMLLDYSKDVPMWVIDGQIDSRKFLVPVNGTSQSLRAVDHLAFILRDNPHAEITLFNSTAIFAHSVPIHPEDFYQQWSKEWCDEHLTRPDSLFHGPEQILRESGFPMDRVRRITTRKGLYPSRQIVRQALMGNYGTIVMGCRPLGISKGVFKSVTAKVFGMAQDVAIWVIECY